LTGPTVDKYLKMLTHAAERVRGIEFLLHRDEVHIEAERDGLRLTRAWRWCQLAE
jgi:hypothetical protein